MEPEPSTSANTTTPPTGTRPPAGPNWALMAFVVSVGALFIASTAWFQSRAALAELRGGSRAQGGDSAAADRTATVDLTGVPTQGPPDAPVVLVEFSDYECPYCIRHFNQTMPQITANYIRTGKIRYAFRDWPVDQLHPQAKRAHEAAHCAGEQKRYWDMHPRMFGPPGSHTPDRLQSVARDVGLDMAAFDACVASGRATPEIRATSDMAQEFGATGTPAFFIGIQAKGTQKVTLLHALSGAQDYAVFAQAIDDVLRKTK
jgi:protein-disulfide isomerase